MGVNIDTSPSVCCNNSSMSAGHDRSQGYRVRGERPDLGLVLGFLKAPVLAVSSKAMVRKPIEPVSGTNPVNSSTTICPGLLPTSLA